MPAGGARAAIPVPDDLVLLIVRGFRVHGNRVGPYNGAYVI